MILASIIASLALIAIDVWIYYQAQNSGGLYILLFGAVSSIAIPFSIKLLLHSIEQKNKIALQQLTKISEIQSLIERAGSQELKIKILKEEYDKLEEIIKLESQRLALLARKESIENSAIQILHELDIIEKELGSLGVSKSVTSKELTELDERISARKRGDLILRLGNREYIIPKDAIENAPFL